MTYPRASMCHREHQRDPACARNLDRRFACQLDVGKAPINVSNFFIVDPDTRRSTTARFGSAPPGRKILIMRQHLDALTLGEHPSERIGEDSNISDTAGDREFKRR